jgi:hypothetical protein
MVEMWAAVARVRRHSVYAAPLDMPAPLAFAAQEVHLDGVVLDNRVEVLGAASRTLLEGITNRVQAPFFGAVRSRHCVSFPTRLFKCLVPTLPRTGPMVPPVPE